MLPWFPCRLLIQIIWAVRDYSTFFNEVARRKQLIGLFEAAERDLRLDSFPRTRAEIHGILTAHYTRHCVPAEFALRLKPLFKCIDDDLQYCAFLAVPANNLRALTVTFTDEQRGAAPAELLEEIIRAAHCMGLGEPTAAMFHLSRVFDFGAKAVAKSLSIDPTGLTIGALAAAIQENARNLKGSAAITSDQERFYNEVVTDLRAFARAYRDDLVHSLRTYSDAEVRSLINIVTAFLGHLEKTLGSLKTPRPPLAVKT